MAQGSVKLANQQGRGTLIALSNYRGPLLLKLVTHAWGREMGESERGTVWAQVLLAKRSASAEGGWWSEGETAVTPLDVAVDRVRARFGRERLVPGHTTWGAWAGEKISFVRVPGG